MSRERARLSRSATTRRCTSTAFSASNTDVFNLDANYSRTRFQVPFNPALVKVQGQAHVLADGPGGVAGT